uniref:Uncharacterized protein n=2 Tax=Chenopodium quinoa TaxID=63459 RepID=A0A803M9Y5_CHEQI
MDSKKSNKIRDIVRLQQILKKWRKVANASKSNTITTNVSTTNTASATTTTIASNGGGSGSGNKGIKFLKKTLSFSDNSVSGTEYVPKGYLAVCVGKELKRYVIPTEYLGHQAFGILLREAEEEFGFHQEGVLKIPSDVAVFEKILQMVQHKREEFYFHEMSQSFEFHASDIDVMSSTLSGCCSPDCDQILQPSLPQLCR